MNWLLILDVAANGGALASTAIAVLFGYRTVTVRSEGDPPKAELERQLDCATYTGISATVAAVAFCVGLMVA